MLGRKQGLTQADWERAWEEAAGYPEAEIKRWVDLTVTEIHRVCDGKRAAVAWSGGKDSLVLYEVCALAGITRGVFVRTDLEYPSFIQWVSERIPPEVETVNTGQDLDWLAKHPDMLFPDGNRAGQWFHNVQHRGQTAYFKREKLDVLLLGRRKKDGNYCGKDGIYTNAQGVTRYSPIRDWPHEAVLGFLRHYHLDLPPIYLGPNGFTVGTGPWPARQHVKSRAQGWRETYLAAPSVVRDVCQAGYADLLEVPAELRRI